MSWRIILKKSKIKVENPKHTEIVHSECLSRAVVLRRLCCTVCWVFYGPLCHGTLKLDICTLFTAFFSFDISSISGTVRT